MSNKKQTGVKWLIEELHKNSRWVPLLIQQQALQIEKQHIVDAILDNRNITSEVTYVDAENYYNENYAGVATVRNKISKEQFYEALNTISRYKEQVTQEFDEMKKNLPEKPFVAPIPLTKETIFRNVPSTRHESKMINVILQHWYLRHWWKDIITVQCTNEITLEHISLIKKSDILSLRNVGNKGVDWLERTLYEAGLTLKD